MSRTSTASSSLPELPASATAVDAALRRLELRPSRRWGQSFLTDEFIADAEAALLESPPGEPLLEIGPGLGLLTGALLRRGLGPLTVVERDPRLAAHLRREFGSRIEVLEGDALEVELPEVRAVVGNLPFSVATPILQRLWKARVPRVVALLQREVAERLAAEPGSRRYGRLTVLGAFYGTTELFQTVPSSRFFPKPQVDGRLIRFSARVGPLPLPRVEALEELLQSLFSSRRKQLGNLIGRVAPGPESWEARAAAAGWPEDWRHRRPEELAPEAFFGWCRAGRPSEGADGS